MTKEKVYRSEDEVYILKEQAVALPDKRAMLVLYMTKARRNKTGNGFKKTVVKVGPMNYWLSLFKDLETNNPAELLRTSMIGYPEDYLVYMNKLHITRSYFKKIITKKFENALYLNDFLDKLEVEKKLGHKDSYATEFNNGKYKMSEYENLKDDIWYDNTHLTFEVGRPRKQPRIIM